jgi:hypothetical protein
MENLDKLKRNLNVVFAGLFMGQVAFAGVVILLLKPELIEDPIKETYAYIVICAMVAGVLATRFIASKRLPVIREMEDDQRKVQSYTSLSIIRFAMMEVPNMLAIVFYLLTGYDVLLYLICAGLLYFLSLIPRSSLVDGELRISRQ